MSRTTDVAEPSRPARVAAAAHPERPAVLASITAATLTAATETTIIAAAMPRIVGELGGFAFHAWVFSAHLRARCTTTPILGKLSALAIVGFVAFLREDAPAPARCSWASAWA